MSGQGEPREDSSEVRSYYHRILPFYDLELADRGDGELWAWAASAPPGCRVLELGAGTGRATAWLARTAGRVVALELAPEMIAVARGKLAGVSNVWLVAADMREAPLSSRFDLVTAIDDPFVDLTRDEDRERAFATAAGHVVPGGRFLLDAAWFRRRSGARREIPAGWSRRIRVRRPVRPGDLGVRSRGPAVHGPLRIFRSREEGGAGLVPARLWSREELEHRARAAGLAGRPSLWDYDRRPWDRETSPRLIAELRRGDSADIEGSRRPS